jgi:glycosyltransferase involved in cell wall biosynthesis
VTTRIGGEGMAIVDGQHALVRDEPTAFAEAVVQLATDRELWERISAAGVTLISDSFSPIRMRVRLQELLAQTVTHYRLQA